MQTDNINLPDNVGLNHVPFTVIGIDKPSSGRLLVLIGFLMSIAVIPLALLRFNTDCLFVPEISLASASVPKLQVYFLMVSR